MSTLLVRVAVGLDLPSTHSIMMRPSAARQRRARGAVDGRRARAVGRTGAGHGAGVGF